ncbi:YihY family inner membrane protein [Kingella negevensis]|uniref:Ribonuclease BN/uncharacterized domain fusion protein n=1 Tax=Kingella negevensis TaxID=1522312 RepID=A0A238HHY9_9NEIS|nr:YihY family inner membrane protein [Kingella negevensis]MDK4679628.1 YihY family inner membrane protein [Kingella negevensis]MDK4682653.1 YihY family inner membrane protein [Kingella negevensis]MDK4684196.1 YihY family inner membrane protein [Kingella negevensis]MDK4689477.1 YihY family inner membrane protein [Kingella negevensis]MDK4690850.1 YihY family inner membrane protein [Kingella negevensis]
MIWTDFSDSLKKLAQHRIAAFLLFIWRRFDDMGILTISGSLTFTTLLAIVPVLAVTLVVVTMFPQFSNMVDTFMLFLNSIIVPSGAAKMLDYLNEFKLQAGKLTTVGLLAMGVTSLMLVQTIEQTFNRIWSVRTQRSWWLRVPMYAVLLVFVPLLAGASISLSDAVLSFGDKHLHLDSPMLSGSLKTLWKVILDALALALLYRTVPNCHVPLRHATGCALLTAICLEGAKWAFSLYLQRFNSYELVYGAFAVFPVFLVWLHLLWTIILTGALLTACCNYWHGSAFQRSAAKPTIFDDVIGILLLLARTPKPLRIRDFRQQLNIGYDRAETLLLTLSEQGYTHKVKDGWQLKRLPVDIVLTDLFAIFVYNAQDEHTSGGEILRDVMEPCSQAMKVSLQELLNAA